VTTGCGEPVAVAVNVPSGVAVSVLVGRLVAVAVLVPVADGSKTVVSVYVGVLLGCPGEV